jgi:energy-coupling factor transporter ATP-binding protein EcfA2
MTQQTITSVEFRNFKALGHFSLRLQSMNILVGPNNSGKSTVVGAFRALAAGIRKAQTKAPEPVEGPRGPTRGYVVPESALPISVENVHTDYVDEDTIVRFRLSNGNHLQLYFPRSGGCFMIPESDRGIRTAANFKSAFPITVGVIPVLGPVEHEEELVEPETVRRNLSTHRASRNFRNYWYHFPSGFDRFVRFVEQTWPGMSLEAPAPVSKYSGTLGMFCLENRMSRELFWSGFGFQIWCQLLTHLLRSADDSVLVIDEPETYLHPDLQRQFLALAREAGPDILMATHSTEIVRNLRRRQGTPDRGETQGRGGNANRVGSFGVGSKHYLNPFS